MHVLLLYYGLIGSMCVILFLFVIILSVFSFISLNKLVAKLTTTKHAEGEGDVKPFKVQNKFG